MVGAQTFNVFANPYPSALNFHSVKLNAANATVPDKFYLWDANVTGSSAVGGWVSMLWNSGTSVYDRTVVSSIGSTSINGTGDIQSGTAFMVDYTGSISFKESNKVTGSNNTLYRPAYQQSQLRANLFAKNSDGTVSINDGVLSTFDDVFSDETNRDDMYKLPNFTENISILRNAKSISIERRKPVNETDTIFYQMLSMKNKGYQLEFTFDAFKAPEGTTAILEDLYLNSKTALSMSAVSRYDFDVNSVNANSAMPNRFRIVFKKLVQFTDIKGYVSNNDIAVDWKVGNEFNIHHYEIEKSTNGTNFVFIGTQLSAGNATASTNYSWLDVNPSAGIYYYRIKCIGNNGVIIYSDKVKVSIAKGSGLPYVYPNPVTENSIGLHLTSMPAGLYNIKLLNETGQVVYSEIIIHAGGTATKIIVPKSTLVSGAYNLEVTAPDKKKTVIKVIVQTK